MAKLNSTVSTIFTVGPYQISIFIIQRHNILRGNGVGLGKLDFLGMALGMEVTGKLAKIMGAKKPARGKKQQGNRC
ncbi:MAG: hypothetical protein AAF542_24685 [Pseudomonadota bacterium]